MEFFFFFFFSTFATLQGLCGWVSITTPERGRYALLQHVIVYSGNQWIYITNGYFYTENDVFSLYPMVWAWELFVDNAKDPDRKNTKLNFLDFNKIHNFFNPLFLYWACVLFLWKKIKLFVCLVWKWQTPRMAFTRLRKPLQQFSFPLQQAAALVSLPLYLPSSESIASVLGTQLN